ncbi:hypothetical protein DZC30_19585 [Comamonas testosteroni]|uniref:Uncharacterized protein n=1 Tax=Comamonas testosteroni TaxID=285 RepID=A0A373FBU8_COMTE|nr:hypothetical protein [Comamonas testosteroni]RGE40952.1 hypothetical protein DZC30_19585 [Comamonas testosteroni]
MKAEPQTQEEIEAFLRTKIETDEAETGLYDLGLSFVVVDRVGPNDDLVFQWFDKAIHFNDLLA